MNETKRKKPIYDLEERTFQFAREIRLASRKFKVTSLTEDDIRQVIRSSGSVRANYIEANESLSKKDFVHRIKICRKESKESAYWIRLIMDTNNVPSEVNLKEMYQEAVELKKIFSSIIEKSK